MQEIVDEVIKTEERASHIIQKAREKATQIKTSVEVELNEDVKKARETAQNLILEEVASAKKEADASYRAAMKEAEENEKRFLESKESEFDRIADKIIDMIKTPDYDRE